MILFNYVVLMCDISTAENVGIFITFIFFSTLVDYYFNICFQSEPREKWSCYFNCCQMELVVCTIVLFPRKLKKELLMHVKMLKEYFIQRNPRKIDNRETIFCSFPNIQIVHKNCIHFCGLFRNSINKKKILLFKSE